MAYLITIIIVSTTAAKRLRRKTGTHFSEQKFKLDSCGFDVAFTCSSWFNFRWHHFHIKQREEENWSTIFHNINLNPSSNYWVYAIIVIIVTAATDTVEAWGYLYIERTSNI